MASSATTAFLFEALGGDISILNPFYEKALNKEFLKEEIEEVESSQELQGFFESIKDFE